MFLDACRREPLSCQYCPRPFRTPVFAEKPAATDPAGQHRNRLRISVPVQFDNSPHLLDYLGDSYRLFLYVKKTYSPGAT